MHACHKEHNVAVDSKVQAVWKTSLNERASRPAMKDGKRLRVNENQVHRPPKRIEEFPAKPLALPFVPEEGVFDVSRGGRSNDDLFHRVRPSISLNTRSQGIPIGPSRSTPSSRRSSSRRCQSASGTFAGSAARLSQTSSRRRSFSSGDKLFRFSAGSAIGEFTAVQISRIPGWEHVESLGNRTASYQDPRPGPPCCCPT